MWNPSICDFACHLTCEIDDYLQINNCTCRDRSFRK